MAYMEGACIFYRFEILGMFLYVVKRKKYMYMYHIFLRAA